MEFSSYRQKLKKHQTPQKGDYYNMDRDVAKQYVKDQLEWYLRQQGINTRKPFCCLNPDHADSNPSMSYDRKRNKVHCFSCGADYDIIDLIKIDYGLMDDKDAFRKAYELYRVELDHVNYEHAKNVFSEKPAAPEVQKPDKSEQKGQDYTDYFLQAHSNIGNTDYLQKRGLTAATIERFKLGYEESFNKGTGGAVWKVIVIPTTKYTYTVRNTDQSVDKKNRIRKVGNNVLFNIGALSGKSPVFVVEGELDALSIIEAGGEAVALGSTANYHKFVKYLQERDIKTPLIALALDNDEDGKKTTDNIIKELGDYKKAAVVTLPDIYGDYKDANDMLINDKQGLIDEVIGVNNILNQEKEKAAEEYQKNNVANHIDDFLNGIKASANTPFIPTGFSELDKVLDGGLYEGLYIVGAISSLGKTTYIMQIADQIAQDGNDVLIFSLEMARTEIMAKSISRLTMLDCLAKDSDYKLAKTSRGITTGKRYEIYSQEEKKLIQKCVLQYAEYGSRIYITEGIGDIGVDQVKEAVKTHISITGRKPIVIIDYLQILAPYDMKASDKQNTDKAVLELKRLSRDYKIPVIGISSLNRQNYNAPISMEAFKESGAIEYSSDVLIGLQLKGVGSKDFDVNTAKKKHPREVEVVILKNRNGSTGDRVDYEYYSMFNYFREIPPHELAFEDGEELSPPNKDGFRQVMNGKTPFDK
jgi:replicative DNA helicase